MKTSVRVGIAVAALGLSCGSARSHGGAWTQAFSSAPVAHASPKGHVAPAGAPAPTHADALRWLQEGNARFLACTTLAPNADLVRVKATGAAGQAPFVTIISCADSRVPPELVFDRGFGDLFVVRVAGNVCDTDEIGTAEYGCGHLKTPLMVVMGHTKCGAVTAVASGASVHGSIPGLVDNIIPAVDAVRARHPGLDAKAIVPLAIRENVFQGVRDVLTRSEELRDLVKAGSLRVVGALYDIDEGRVEWLGDHPDQAALLESTGSAGVGGHVAHGPGHPPAKGAKGEAPTGSGHAVTSHDAPEPDAHAGGRR